jgi:hypothetical protein
VTFLNIQKFINPHYIKDPTTEKKPRAKKEVADEKTESSTGDAAPKEKKVRPKVAKAPAS